MSYESLVMKYCDKGYGLCICGLGITGYCHMCVALYTVLQLLLPQGDSFICSQVDAIGNDSNNGFELLWLLQKRYITIFNLTKEPFLVRMARGYISIC